MTKVLQFGRFALRPSERTLSDGAHTLPIGARAFDVLTLLVERAGDLVTKNELMQHVWADLVVEENNLHVQVSALRRVLGSESIATVAGRGYRFTLPVERVTPAAPPADLAVPGLPRPLTRFHGRDREIALLSERLESFRLVTLLGIGGCGKTRLAIEWSRRCAAQGRHVVVFADITGVSEAAHVAHHVSRELAIREQGDHSPVDRIAAWVADRSVILVLDNCEHVLEACAALSSQLLTRAPSLRIVATSRMPLGLPGEDVMPVNPLELPADAAADDVPGLLQTEAVALFIDRASQADPDFVLDKGNATVVHEVCRRLDGIPLALELAAARLKVLTLEQIRDRLLERFALLVGGRSSPPRQRTLNDAIRWSYEQLALDERELFERLGVLCGSWSLAAAQAVAGHATDELGLVRALSSLVDHSMLVVVRHDNERRYTLLETVRQFALDNLRARGAGAAAHARHAAYFRDLAETLGAQLRTRGARPALARLDVELPNLLAAAFPAHAFAERDGETSLRIVAALRRYFRLRGLVSYGRRLLEQCMESHQSDAISTTWLSAQCAVGELAYLQGDYATARRVLEQAVRAPIEPEADTAAMLPLFLGGVAFAEGRTDDAMLRFEETLARGRATANGWAMLSAWNALGEVHRARGSLDEANKAYTEAQAIARSNDLAHPSIDLNLAIISIERRRFDPARTQLKTALNVAVSEDNVFTAGEVFDVLGALAAATGDSSFAGRMRGASDALYERSSVKRIVSDVPFLDRYLALAKSDLGEVAFRECHSQGASMSLAQALAQAAEWLDSQPNAAHPG